jgi:steroid delta-isomerase-like uncharacterized protein
MSTTAAHALVARFYDGVLNERRLEVIEEIAVENYVENDPLPGQGEGREGLRDRVLMLTSALEPVFTVEDVIAEGDRVAVRWRQHGRQVKPFLGLPASNKSFEISGIDIYRVAGGRLAEHWHVVDQFAMLIQLGFLPAPEVPQ